MQYECIDPADPYPVLADAAHLHPSFCSTIGSPGGQSTSMCSTGDSSRGRSGYRVPSASGSRGHPVKCLRSFVSCRTVQLHVNA